MMQAGQDWSGDDGSISGKRLFALSISTHFKRRPSLANGRQPVKSFRYLLTDPRQFDILQSGRGWRVPNAIRSIETTGVRHASGRRSLRMAARGARAAARDASGRVFEHRGITGVGHLPADRPTAWFEPDRLR